MKTKSLIAFLIGFLAIRLPAQNSASHQVTINIIRSNSVSVESIPVQSAMMKQSGATQQPAALLTWQTGGNPNKITLSTDENQSLGIETASSDLEGAERRRLSEADQNWTFTTLQGNGRRLIKWPAQQYNENGELMSVSLTVVEI
jgi:hypothetical protein